jgi:sugar/nucleoside kinase (ribokinase family)
MSKRNGITAAGTWVADYTKVVTQFPSEGSCTVIESEHVNNGGAPYNLLIDLRRLGATFPLRAIGCVGHDVDGSNILKDCLAHQFDVSKMHVIPEMPTSFSDVMTSIHSGIRTSFNQPGANAALSESHFHFSSNTSRIFYLGTLFFMAGLDAPHSKYGTLAAKVLSRARKAGMLTCIDIERCSHLDSNVFRAGALAALSQTDLIVINVEVAELLTGIRIRKSIGVDIPVLIESAFSLLQKTLSRCVVIRFPAGAVGVTKENEVVIEGSIRLPSNRFVNASGAGNAFVAGFLYSYHEKLPLADCLCAAHATAAACLMDATTSGGIRQMPTCLKLLERFGQRDLGQHTAATNKHAC